MDKKNTDKASSGSGKKRVKEMTVEEQIAYYQYKASRLKKKRAEEKKNHYENIGRIFERIFGEVTGSDKEIEEVFSVMLESITHYHNSIKHQNRDNQPL